MGECFEKSGNTIGHCGFCKESHLFKNELKILSKSLIDFKIYLTYLDFPGFWAMWFLDFHYALGCFYDKIQMNFTPNIGTNLYKNALQNSLNMCVRACVVCVCVFLEYVRYMFTNKILKKTILHISYRIQQIVTRNDEHIMYKFLC